MDSAVFSSHPCPIIMTDFLLEVLAQRLVLFTEFPVLAVQPLSLPQQGVQFFFEGQGMGFHGVSFQGNAISLGV
jgi:hypothetical protein